MTSPSPTSARNPWKLVAIAATTALWLVCGILYSLVAGQADRQARMQLRTAQTIPAEGAACILDRIPLSDLDLDLAEEIAQARVEAWLRLFRERVLRDGVVPTPYELAPYRLDRAASPPREELSRVTSRLRSAIAERRGLADRSSDAALERADSLARVAQYALGELGLDQVCPFDTEARYQLGDLLFRERQFDRAIEMWRPILDAKRVVRRLAELGALRRLAPHGLHVWDYDVQELLGRDPLIEADAAARMEELFRQASGSPRPDAPVLERRGIPRDDVAEATDEPAIFFPEGDPEDDPVPAEHWIDAGPDQLFLLSDHAQFRLEARTDRPFATIEGARFMLHSAYLGPIHARLFRVSGREAFDGLVDETLVARRSELTPVQEWETQFAPIWENSMRVGKWELQVPRQGPGFYVLIVDARYCPVYAVARFAVTDVALVQQVASDRVLLFAADRASGAPVAGLPIEGRVTGRYALGPSESSARDDADPVGFQRGFEEAWEGRETAPDATPAYRRGFLRGSVLRARHPVFEATFRGETGEDGLFEWAVSPRWEPGYRYTVRADTPSTRACSFVETTWSLDAKSKTLKALVYGDRPLYRPGDSVSFKALLRRFDDEGLHAYDGQEARFEIATSRRVVHSQSCAVTDVGTASGSFRLPVDCELGRYSVRVDGGPAQPLFEVEEYRRPEFEVVLEHARQVVAGSPVEVKFHVRYFTGAPVANATVTVTLDSSPAAPEATIADWFSDAPASARGGWRRLESRTLRTDDAGRCACVLATEDGVAARYVVTARAREESRREVTTSSIFEATAEAPEAESPASPAPEPPARGTGIRVRLDRPYYRVGETAKLLVEGPARHVLVTLATGRIRFRQVVELREGAAEVPIAIGEDEVPNVEVVALAVREDRLDRATARLLVSPEDRFLTVEVQTDRSEYRPGQSCRATVRVTDSKGRPVPDCEISLGVVDEAIYALREDATPDLREFFHRWLRPYTVEESFLIGEPPRTFIVWKAPTFVRGMFNYFEAMGGGGGGRYGGRFGGRENLVARGGGMASGKPRADFRETAYWNAHLKTDAEGRASVAFPLPDNLTRYRFTAHGITRDHKVGEVKQTTIVRMPFHVRFVTPRVLQEGNTLALSGLVHNDTGTRQAVRCSLDSPFPVLRSTAPASLVLEPGEVARVQYLVSIDRYLPQAGFTFGAACEDGPADSVLILVPGRRHAMPFQVGRSGSVQASAPREEAFSLPPEAIHGALSLDLHVNAGVRGAVLDALEPLIEYPYGCVEQTMSRFLPAVAARSALGEGTHRWSERLPAVVEAGLERLYGFQHADGGWGWWKEDATNAGMTAYVLYGLSRCRKAGVQVRRDVVERAAGLLRGQIEEAVYGSAPFPTGRAPLPKDVDPRVYALLALAEHESAWDGPSDGSRRVARALVEDLGEAASAEEVMLALACERLGAQDEAERLAGRAMARPSTDVLTASFLLQLQAERGGEVRDPARFVLLGRQGNGWRTTLESAYAILGLASALGRPMEERSAPGRVRIEVDGVEPMEVALTEGLDPSFDGRVRVAEPPPGWGERVVVRLSVEGDDMAFYAASLQGMNKSEGLASSNTGIDVSREYFVKIGNRWRLVEGDVPVGGTVLVHLQVRSDAPREYVMVTDPRGDGFEPVGGLAPCAREDGVAFAPPVAVASMEHRDDRTLFFLNALPEGVSHLYYEVRAELPGEINVLPPQATPMYEPEVHGCGMEARLIVIDEPLMVPAAMPR